MSKNIEKKRNGVNINVRNIQPEQILPKFCNYVNINIHRPDNEVLLDFIWHERNIAQNTKEIPGFLITRIVMTLEHAKRFNNVLNDLISEKPSSKKQ